MIVMSYRLNREVLVEVLTMMEIMLPVEVTMVDGLVHLGALGVHTPVSNDDGKFIYHQIHLENGLNRGELSRALVHELTHAAQAEAAGTYDAYVAEVKAQRAAAGLPEQIMNADGSRKNIDVDAYEKCPWEAQAIEMEKYAPRELFTRVFS